MQRETIILQQGYQKNRETIILHRGIKKIEMWESTDTYMVSGEAAGIDLLSPKRIKVLNFEQGQKGLQELSWVCQKAVLVDLAPHRASTVSPPGHSAASHWCNPGCRKEFHPGLPSPSPLLKAGMKGEVVSSTELWKTGRNSTCASPGGLCECSDVFMHLFTRIFVPFGRVVISSFLLMRIRGKRPA